MAALKAEPAGRVHSMSEFFALASEMERDAADRYIETARQLRQQNAHDLADVFDSLAETERGHVAQVEQWAGTKDAASPADRKIPWPIPDTFDAPPSEMARSKLLTPYRALASAVRHEQRSFAFWSYVSAHAESEDVKSAAENMALEELDHVSILRRERRKAFHSELRSGAREEPVHLGALAVAERRLADLIACDPKCVVGGQAFASKLAASGREAASKIEDLDAATNRTIVAPCLSPDRIDGIASIAEYLVEAYLRLAESSKEARVLGVAQELAKSAIYRLGVLNLEIQSTADGAA